MGAVESIANDLKLAQKAKDELAVSALRVIRAEMTNAAIAKMKKELTDEEALEVIRTQVKRLREAISDFERGGRADLVAKNKKEIELLQKYLPVELSEEEVRKEIQTILGAGSYQASDFGKAMKEAMARLKGRADGVTVSRILKELLQSS